WSGDRIRHDPGPGLARDRSFQCRRGRDEDLLAAVREEVDRRLDLRAHAALGKLALGEVLGGLGGGDRREEPLVGLPKVPRALLDTGGEHEERHLEARGEQGRRPVLVDDRLDPLVPAARLDDRDPAAAAPPPYEYPVTALCDMSGVVT